MKRENSFSERRS